MPGPILDRSAERWSHLSATDVKALAADCVHCGFCLPACPTYLLWGREADSPRGRIYLLTAALDRRMPADAVFRDHIDRCLGCMACVTACPSGVRYGRLLEHARLEAEAAGRPLTDRVYRSLIFSLFPYPRRLKWIARGLRAAQRLGLQRAFRASGVPSLLPKRLAALEQIAPTVGGATERLPAVIPASGEPRRRVGLLLGCVQRVFFGAANAATARVLAAEGCEVVVPREQECCGALMLHAGRIDAARIAARALIAAFQRTGVDHIVINAAGCGSAMKEYGVLLKDDPEYAAAAAAFSAKCVDVSELLAGLEPRAARHPVNARVAYHDACHLSHGQGIREAPRAILRTIPGVQLREIAEPELCCGSAGVYNLLEPDAAAALRDRKVGHVRSAGADVLVSANPGCLLQIQSGLRAAGDPMRTMHIVELLDSSIGVQGVQRMT
jgi:glycolate dehydrogenase iron-sulfur subunit